MNKKFFRILLPIFIVAMLLCSLMVIAFAEANDSESYPDAMVNILADAELSQYKIEQVHYADEGYLHIPVDVTMYFDAERFDVSFSYANKGGTTFVLYVVNTRTERAGTDSDVEIILSMIERGYVVAVADYHNHKKTVPDEIEWSTQKLVNTLAVASQYKSTDIGGSGTYREPFIVPAGHNLTRDIVYWEYDKHGVDGTLEYIVSVWNNDFRGVKGDIILPWHSDGERKATQKGLDGTTPVWYSKTTDKTAAGVVSSNGEYFVPDENGLYTKVKYTLAKDITDCVQIDGTPIDLNLYLYIIYPTNPVESVPTMTLQSSSEYTLSGAIKDGRPHTYAFAFEGYAVALYDYAYVPMSRNDHYGYFDGSSLDKGSITGDNRTYSCHTYNNMYVSTASLRCLRYLAESQPETYRLNGKIGVIGNSKASIITPMADLDLNHTLTLADGFATVEALETYAYEYLSTFEQEYYLSAHHGETRYDVGRATYTKNGATIDGGEIQPWLTYNGAMLPSGAEFVYSCCGSRITGIDENYAAVMTTGHTELETTAYGSNGFFYSYMDEYDLVSLYFELALGHMFLQRECDMLGIDPYICYKDFVNYVLKGDAATVLYTTPLVNSEISTTSPISIKFSGVISASEIAKATLTDKDGNVVLGTFESAFGGTEWTFTPATALHPNMEYTLTIPDTIVDANGNRIASRTLTYYTENGASQSLEKSGTISNENGMTLTLTVPDLSAYKSAGVNRASLAFNVTDDAANRIEIYEGSASGTLLASVPVGGRGVYTADITSLLASMSAGSALTLYVKTAKRAGAMAPSATSILTIDDGNTGNFRFANGSSIYDLEGHGKVVRALVKPVVSEYVPEHQYYTNSGVFEIRNLLSMTASDIGRRFVITFDVYDTTSRMISLSGGSLSNSTTGIVDYDRDVMNFESTAGVWQTVSFELTIDEPSYGKNGYKNKGFSVSMYATGDTEAPAYFDNFRIEEITTDVTLGGVSLVLENHGGAPYKAGTSDKPFAVGTETFSTLKDAIAKLGTNGGTITLQNNVTLTDSDVITDVNASAITIDLNGYEIRTNIASKSLISPSNATCLSYTLKNGSLYLSGGSLVGLENVKSATKVTVTLENAFVAMEDGATTQNVLVNPTATIASSLKLVLKNTSIDIHYARCTKNPVVMLPASTDTLSIYTEFYGGQILVTDAYSLTLFGGTKNLKFYLYEDNYTTFYLTNGLSLDSMTLATNEMLCALEANPEAEAPRGYQAYTLTRSENSTPYGIIPEEYRDVEKYPFVIFNADTNLFIGAASIFSADDNTSATGILVSGNGSKGNFAIYMRRDATHDTGSYNIGKIHGTLTVDLGGHTLSYTTPITAQLKYNGFVENVIFTNGTILANTTKAQVPFIASTAGSKNGQEIHVTFRGITFCTIKGFSSMYWVSSAPMSGGNTEKEYAFTVTAEDCVFDTSNITTQTALFTIGHSTGLAKSGATLIGSTIYGDPSYVTICKQYSTLNTTFNVLRGEDGNYITNTRPTSSETPSTSVMINGSVLLFNKPIETKGDMTTYALDIDALSTPYGRIPETYAQNPAAYPILLFNTVTGEVIWAGTQWGGETSADGSTLGGVLEVMNNNCTKGTLAIYLQGDVTGATTFFNHGRTQGSHIIDLNGHTISLSSGASLFYAQAKATNLPNYSASFQIKNGTVNVGSGIVMTIASNNKTGNNAMLANYTFENVNFVNIAPKGVIFSENSGNFITTTNILFDECSFYYNKDRTNALFTLGGMENFTVNVTLCGGSITTQDAKLPVLLAPTSGRTLTNRTLTIARGESGFPVITTLKNATEINDEVYETNLGPRYLVLSSSTDTQNIYRFCAKTEYGYIPEIYEDVEKYPLLLIDPTTGKVLWAGDKFGGETKADGSSVGGVLEALQLQADALKRSLIIYLQRDLTNAETYYNFGRTAYSHTIDLGGHTLTSSDHIFYAEAKTATAMNITVKNGTIVLTSGKTVVYLSTKSTVSNKIMNFVFENVTFTLSHKNSTVVADSSVTTPFSAELIFNNCTFNVPNTSTTTAVFYIGLGAQNASIDITVNGGRFVLTPRTQLPIFINSKDYEKHTLTFGMYEGQYPTVACGKGLDTSAFTFLSETGVLGLRKTGTNDTSDLYVLSPMNFVSAYLNLTSELNLVYRVFLPAGYQSPSVTFCLGDRTMVVTSYTVDENGLLLFRLPSINPAEMGLAIVATLSAELDGARINVTNDTLSVKSYLETLKAANADNALLTELADSILLYGAAAQVYLGMTDGLVTTPVVSSPIPESENTLVQSGEANADYAITKLGMRLEGAFAMRLTIRATSLEGLSLVVTQNGKSTRIDLSEMTLTDGTVVVYYDLVASELSDTLTFTLSKGDTAIGKTLTTTANAYLYRIGSGEEPLALLARAIYAYAKSAKAYADTQ